jgi:hypothetical protein
MFFEAFLEQLLGDDTCLWKAVHPLLYFAVDVAIGVWLCRGDYSA